MDQAGPGSHGGPEPRAVVPPTEVVGAGGIGGALVDHVGMGIPEAAIAAVGVDIPGGIGGPGQAGHGVGIGITNHTEGARINKGLVLDDEGDAVAVHAGGITVIRNDPGVDELFLYRIHDEVAGSFTGIHVQAGEPEGVIVVEHEPATLLVGPVVGGHAVAGGANAHVWYIPVGSTLLVAGGLTSGGIPLVGRAVTDPGAEAAVEVELGPVLGEELGATQGAHTGTVHGGVHREEQVSGPTACEGIHGPEGQLVGHLHAHGAIPLGDDDGAKVVRVVRAIHRALGGRVEIPITAELGGIQLAVQLLRVLLDADLVVVRGGVEGIGHGLGHGDEVPQVVGVRGRQARQAVHELVDGLGVVPVAGRVEDVVGLLELEAGARGAGSGTDDDALLSATTCQASGLSLGLGLGLGLGIAGLGDGHGGVHAELGGIDLAALGLEGRLGADRRSRPGIGQGTLAGHAVDDRVSVATCGGRRAAIRHHGRGFGLKA